MSSVFAPFMVVDTAVEVQAFCHPVTLARLAAVNVPARRGCAQNLAGLNGYGTQLDMPAVARRFGSTGAGVLLRLWTCVGAREALAPGITGLKLLPNPASCGPTVLLRVASAFRQSLTHIDLGGCCGVGDVAVAALAGLGQLQSVDLTRCESVTDAGITALFTTSGTTVTLPHLHTLTVAHCHLLTDVALGILQSQPQLRHLVLAGLTRITNQGLLQLLSAQPPLLLERLDVAECNRISDTALSALPSLPLAVSLKTLSLSRCDSVTDEGVTALKGLPALTDLDTRDCADVTCDAFVEFLRPSSSLTTTTTTTTTESPARLPQLRRLSIGLACDVGDEGIEGAVQHMRELEYLNLAESMDVTDVGVAMLSPLQRLRHLDLGGCDSVTDVGVVAAVSQMPELRHLSLSHLAGVTDATLSRAVARLEHLTHLDLGCCSQITDEGLAVLSGCALRQLALMECTGITDAGLERLAGPQASGRFAKSLELLDLSCCPQISDSGIAGLARRGLPALTDFSVTGCVKLTDGTLSVLARAAPKLVDCSIYKCRKVTNRGIAAMAHDLRHLARLCACETQMGDVGLRDLANSDNKFTHLYISVLPEVSDAGIATLVSRQEELQTLNLACNPLLTDAAVRSLSTLKQLRQVKLSGCPLITAEGRKQLSPLVVVVA